MCGAYGHTFEECLYVETIEETDHTGINVLPIEETVTRENDWAEEIGYEEDGYEMPI